MCRTADAFGPKRGHPKYGLAAAVVLANGGGISLTFTFPFAYMPPLGLWGRSMAGKSKSKMRIPGEFIKRSWATLADVHDECRQSQKSLP
jgi:hypothetical protein